MQERVCDRCGGRFFFPNVDGDLECFACGKVFYLGEISQRIPDVVVSKEYELTEAEVRKNIRYLISHTFELDGLLYRWLSDAPKVHGSMFRSYCSKTTPDEYWVRWSIRETIRLGGDLKCLFCGVELTRADDIYSRRYVQSPKVLCEVCAIQEVLSVLHIRLCIGNWVIKKRSYERIWKAKAVD